MEVLSPSTATFDREEKFADYCQLESLEECGLIAQDEQRVECRRRVREAGTERWETVVYTEGDRVLLASVGLVVAIEDLYRGVNSLTSYDFRSLT